MQGGCIGVCLRAGLQQVSVCRCRNGGVDYCVPSWSQHEPVYCGACWLHATMTMISVGVTLRLR